MRKSQPNTDRHLRANNAVATKEVLFTAEHMHRSAFSTRIATLTTSQLSHDTICLHATSQHMSMIAIRCHYRIAFHRGRLQTNNNSFLTDIKMTKTTNLTHAVHLTCFFFKTSDQQHIAKHFNQIIRCRHIIHTGSN